MNKLLEDIELYRDLEKQFFDFDDKNKSVRIKLEFDKVSDVFNVNFMTKMPVISDDFISWLYSAFELTPNNYKTDISVRFKDMCGFTSEQLQEVFTKNMLLEYKKLRGESKRKKHIAFNLIGIGAVFFTAMVLIESLWTDGGFLSKIFSYFSDIATTVTIWEAMNILVVENKENRSYMRNIISRFGSIDFIPA